MVWSCLSTFRSKDNRKIDGTFRLKLCTSALTDRRINTKYRNPVMLENHGSCSTGIVGNGNNRWPMGGTFGENNRHQLVARDQCCHAGRVNNVCYLCTSGKEWNGRVAESCFVDMGSMFLPQNKRVCLHQAKKIGLDRGMHFGTRYETWIRKNHADRWTNDRGSLVVHDTTNKAVCIRQDQIFQHTGRMMMPRGKSVPFISSQYPPDQMKLG